MSAGSNDGGEPASWVSWIRLALAVGLVAIALRALRRRPSGKPEQAELPGWMDRVDSFTPARSLAAGLLLSSVLNPKNLILTFSAAATIAESDASSAQQAVALAIFIAIGTLGAAVPVALYFGMREDADRLLDRVRRWMAHNKEIITAIICLAIAAMLTVEAISALSSVTAP